MANALRVTPAGRPIVLSLGGTPVFQVRDGGPGLSEEDYQVAFDRGALYRRYEGIRPVGTGLGLAIVHGLVTRMGGTVSAGPAPEGGACFTIMLSG
jgi:signal transduction histidine kinase